MKKLLMFIAFALTAMVANAQFERVVGTWVTVDDKSGEEKSIVQIFKATNGMYYGKILTLFDENLKDAVCTKCKDENKDKPVVGMIFMKAMKPDGDVLRGTLLDPESGKTYYGSMSLVNDNKLKLRGSLDAKGVLGRTQYWIRKK